MICSASKLPHSCVDFSSSRYAALNAFHSRFGTGSLTTPMVYAMAAALRIVLTELLPFPSRMASHLLAPRPCMVPTLAGPYVSVGVVAFLSCTCPAMSCYKSLRGLASCFPGPHPCCPPGLDTMRHMPVGMTAIPLGCCRLRSPPPLLLHAKGTCLGCPPPCPPLTPLPGEVNSRSPISSGCLHIRHKAPGGPLPLHMRCRTSQCSSR